MVRTFGSEIDVAYRQRMTSETAEILRNEREAMWGLQRLIQRERFRRELRAVDLDW